MYTYYTLLQDMIRKWIEANNLEGPCWKTLLEAVAAEYGGQNIALASRLAPNHQGTCMSLA